MLFLPFSLFFFSKKGKYRNKKEVLIYSCEANCRGGFCFSGSQIVNFKIIKTPFIFYPNLLFLSAWVNWKQTNIKSIANTKSNCVNMKSLYWLYCRKKKKGLCKEDVTLRSPNIIRKFLLRSWKLLIYYPNILTELQTENKIFFKNTTRFDKLLPKWLTAKK